MKDNRWKYKTTNRDFFADLRKFIVGQVKDIKDVNAQISALDQLADSPELAKIAERAAKRMVIQSAVTNAQNWREAAKKSMKILYKSALSD